MFDLDSKTLLMFITTIVSGLAVVGGTITATVMEGKAVIAAFQNMARQPSVADRISGSIFVVMALLESTAIYVLLVVLILLFANPFVSLFS